MRALDILIDAAHRPRQHAARFARELDPSTLNARVGGHDNSIAWLLWHTGREIDAQVAQLAGSEERWATEDFAMRTGLGERGGSVGYGHSPEEARAIVVDDAGLLLDYLDAATESLITYLESLEDSDLDDVIDESWDPPVTRGVRLMSIIDDAAQHIGQAAYAAGAPSRS